MLELFYKDSFIEQIVEGGWVKLPNGDVFAPAYAGWSNDLGYELREAKTELVEAPPLNLDDYRVAIDSHVESTARLWGYNGAAHIASYVNSTVVSWKVEASAFIAWRDQVWLKAIEDMTNIAVGKMEVPEGIDAYLSTLPEAHKP